MDRRRAIGVALVLVSAFGFGSGSLFAKPAYEQGINWQVLSAYRFLFGAAVAWGWVLLWPNLRGAVRRFGRRAALVSLALGLLYVGNSGTYYAGLETVDASLAALIVYIYPATVAVLSLRFGRRLEGARAWAALAIATIGVGLAVGGIGPNPPPLSGLVLVIVSPLIYSVWIILSARLSGERRDSDARAAPAPGDPAATAAIATALMMTATASAYWLIALATGEPVLPSQVPAAVWPNLVGIGVFATFVAIQAFFAGAQRVGAAQAALISTIEPIWTISLAALLLGESLQPIQLVGGALIIGAVVLAQTGSGAASEARPAVRLADE